MPQPCPNPIPNPVCLSVCLSEAASPQEKLSWTSPQGTRNCYQVRVSQYGKLRQADRAGTLLPPSPLDPTLLSLPVPHLPSTGCQSCLGCSGRADRMEKLLSERPFGPAPPLKPRLPTLCSTSGSSFCHQEGLWPKNLNMAKVKRNRTPWEMVMIS